MTDESLDRRRYEKLRRRIANLTDEIMATKNGPQREAMIHQLEQLADEEHRALGRALGDDI